MTEARAILDRLEAGGRSGYVPSYGIAPLAGFPEYVDLQRRMSLDRR
jgi:hypothetical protein